MENDCELASSPIPPSMRSVYSWVLPYEDLTVAYDNLFAYCCKIGWFVHNEICGAEDAPKEIHEESPYLYEQLVDIWFRHLDVESAYSGQIIDSGALAWYRVLHPITWDAPLTPLLVQAQYKSYWTLTHTPLLQDEAGDLKNYLPLYSWFSLRDKYYNWCMVAKYAYENTLQPDKTKWPIDIGDQYNPASFYNACMRLAWITISQELVFTQSTMIDSATNTLWTTIESYTLTNFVKDRLMSLLDKLKAIVSLFTKITKQAPLSKSCSQ